jgi:hypothetical protein
LREQAEVARAGALEKQKLVEKERAEQELVLQAKVKAAQEEE